MRWAVKRLHAIVAACAVGGPHAGRVPRATASLSPACSSHSACPEELPSDATCNSCPKLDSSGIGSLWQRQGLGTFSLVTVKTALKHLFTRRALSASVLFLHLPSFVPAAVADEAQIL